MEYVVQIEMGGDLGQYECYLKAVPDISLPGGGAYVTTPDPAKAMVFPGGVPARCYSYESNINRKLIIDGLAHGLAVVRPAAAVKKHDPSLT